MKRLILSATVIAVIGMNVAAQFQVDRSVIVTGSAHVYHLDRTNDRMTTVTKAGSGREYSAICMHRSNDLALVVDRVGKTILQVSPRGVFTTMIRVSSSTHIQGIALDQSGQHVMCDNFARAILMTTGSNGTGPLTTIKTLGTPPQAICIDDDTGDYVVAVHRIRPAASALLRIHRRTRSVTTIASGLGSLTGVDHDQTTGNFVVTTRTTPHVRVIGRDGRTLFTSAFTNANAVRIDDESGDVWVASTNRVRRYSPDLSGMNVYPTLSQAVFHGLELWGRQKVAGDPDQIPTRGAHLELRGKFPASVRQGYACALGMSGLRPGLPVQGGRTLNVAIDSLFFATVNGRLPVFTTGFAGTTSSTGSFTARFLVPPVGIGTHFVFTAAALNSAKPGNLDVAASHVFNVQ